MITSHIPGLTLVHVESNFDSWTNQSDVVKSLFSLFLMVNSCMALSERIASPNSSGLFSFSLFIYNRLDPFGVAHAPFSDIFRHSHIIQYIYNPQKPWSHFEEDQFQSRCQADCLRRRASAQRTRRFLGAEPSNLKGAQWLDPYPYPVF